MLQLAFVIHAHLPCGVLGVGFGYREGFELEELEGESFAALDRPELARIGLGLAAGRGVLEAAEPEAGVASG